MHRFYFPQQQFSSGQTVNLIDRDEIHHLKNVLRLKSGSEVFLFNGMNQEAQGEISGVSSHEIQIRIKEVKSFLPKVPKVILACAIPKRSKFELIIEKATELGVDEVIPLKTKRSEVDIKEEKAGKKTLRYQTVAINAAKQCQRNTIPVIHPLTEFKNIVGEFPRNSLAIIPSLQPASKNVLKVFEEIKDPLVISFMIGPEGDFTPEEYTQAQTNGWIPVTLGPTVLKVETAAITAIASAQLYFSHG